MYPSGQNLKCINKILLTPALPISYISTNVNVNI